MPDREELQPEKYSKEFHGQFSERSRGEEIGTGPIRNEPTYYMPIDPIAPVPPPPPPPQPPTANE